MHKNETCLALPYTGGQAEDLCKRHCRHRHMRNGIQPMPTFSPFQDVSIALEHTSYRRWRRACPLKASLALKMPPRASSINVAHLKTLAEIVAQPEQDRYEIHEQIDARVSTTDKWIQYLMRHGLIQKTGVKELYHDRFEYEGTDAGIFLIRTWQCDRSITDVIAGLQTAIEITQGSRESSINVALLHVLKQIVAGRVSTVAELMPLCNHNRQSTRTRLKNLVNRKLLNTDCVFNMGGSGHGNKYTTTKTGRKLIDVLGC